MLELADKTDFWNFSDEEFECPMGNCRSRISLIKQFDRMRINSTEGRLKSVTASRQGGKSNCNGSLAYGDIGFGDGELN